MPGLAGETVLLRADGGADRGIGHLMRCLALADALADSGAEPVLWTHSAPDHVAALYASRGIAIIAEPPPVKAAWLIVDSYDIHAAERQSLAATCDHLLVIDDVGDNGPYECDIVLNPNPGARVWPYDRACDHGRNLLVGADYTLLRKDVVAAKADRPKAPIQNILISCGGTDPAGAAVHALKAAAISAPEDMCIRVLGGVGKGVNVDTVAQGRQVESVVASFDIAAHLNWADMAVLAAGTTQWEAAYLGCPFVSIVVADNQWPGAYAFAQLGGCMCVDWREQADAHGLADLLGAFLQDDAKRTVQASKASQFIDGKGAARVAAAMDQMV